MENAPRDRIILAGIPCHMFRVFWDESRKGWGLLDHPGHTVVTPLSEWRWMEA
jgi:hypothetical protein